MQYLCARIFKPFSNIQSKWELRTTIPFSVEEQQQIVFRGIKARHIQQLALCVSGGCLLKIDEKLKKFCSVSVLFRSLPFSSVLFRSLFFQMDLLSSCFVLLMGITVLCHHKGTTVYKQQRQERHTSYIRRGYKNIFRSFNFAGTRKPSNIIFRQNFMLPGVVCAIHCNKPMKMRMITVMALIKFCYLNQFICFFFFFFIFFFRYLQERNRRKQAKKEQRIQRKIQLENNLKLFVCIVHKSNTKYNMKGIYGFVYLFSLRKFFFSCTSSRCCC